VVLAKLIGEVVIVIVGRQVLQEIGNLVAIDGFPWPLEILRSIPVVLIVLEVDPIPHIKGTARSQKYIKIRPGQKNGRGLPFKADGGRLIIDGYSGTWFIAGRTSGGGEHGARENKGNSRSLDSFPEPA
jgi:hypothetical protein